jgi:hypothetical protein
MRVNLITHSCGQIKLGTGAIPLSLKIRPACGLPGEYEYATDSAAVVWMLRKQTDLPPAVIERFEERMYTAFNAHLLGVELSEKTLTEIGYFVD